MLITVGARSSPLSQAQVAEVLYHLHKFHPHVHFNPRYMKSTGDCDKLTSLRSMGKTDFFTKEIDQLVLTGHCRIGIHSAKDLPEPLPIGLKLVALTCGVDPSDSLVLRQNETLLSLKSGALIATSSERREDAVKALRADLAFCDLRGTIHERLQFLEAGQADGVVVAEAALLRLGLTHLNRIKVPGDTVPLQGKLAILAQDADAEMETLFKCLDSR